jgi:hypothetical protein
MRQRTLGLRVNRFTVSAAIILAAISLSSAAQAMQIQLFDRMAAQDQQNYINLLFEGAEKVLIQASQQNDAAKARQLLTYIHQGDALPRGEAEFEGNLDNARVFDAKRHLDDPNARRLEVEDALVVTLKKNGITLPKTFLTVGSDFKPKYPPPH